MYLSFAATIDERAGQHGDEERLGPVSGEEVAKRPPGGRRQFADGGNAAPRRRDAARAPTPGDGHPEKQKTAAEDQTHPANRERCPRQGDEAAQQKGRGKPREGQCHDEACAADGQTRAGARRAPREPRRPLLDEQTNLVGQQGAGQEAEEGRHVDQRRSMRRLPMKPTAKASMMAVKGRCSTVSSITATPRRPLPCSSW